ncbi:MAG: outer membrane protein [Myxococcaceae bacterium]|nr:outer membrane protein [Myxococcaceae bacterium]
MDTRILRTAIAVCSLVYCVLGGFAPRSARAQAQVGGYAIDRYEPSDRGSDWFVNESLDFRGSPRPAAGIVTEWAYRPLVLYDPAKIQGDARATAILDQVVLHAGAAFVLEDRVRVAFNVPLLIFQDGDDLAGIATTVRSPGKAAIGDVRASSDLRILGQYGGPISAAVGAQVYFPTGSRSLYTSDGTLRVTPRLLVAGDFAGFFYAAKLGFAYRPLDATFDGRPLGSEAIFAIAGGVKVNDRFVLGPEFYGSTVVTGGDRAFRTRNTPLELLLGAHITVAEHWKTGCAIGPGFTRADGTPSMRVVFSVELEPAICNDPDGDGICTEDDACPTVDGVPQNHGCPADRDFDGFNDEDDACPDEAGTRTADPKTAGCPDRDEDGVADKNDACIDVPGVPTEDPKTNGCPTAGAPVEKVVFPEHVRFAPDASVIGPDAAGALTAIAKRMKENPDLRVRVEGHADDREAKPADVKKLTVDRAEAVKTWLEAHGVDAARMRTEGYGADRLVDTTGTDRGRAKNRRVEIHAVEEAADPPKN